jgi:hypothetical protein
MAKMDRHKIHPIQNNRAGGLDNAAAVSAENHARREQEPRVSDDKRTCRTPHTMELEACPGHVSGPRDNCYLVAGRRETPNELGENQFHSADVAHIVCDDRHLH